MSKAILATKVGMTQLFFKNGEFAPVTILIAGPCFVTQIKTIETDGYNAVQVGFSDKIKNVLKPMAGVFKKANIEPKKYLREFHHGDIKVIKQSLYE